MRRRRAVAAALALVAFFSLTADAGADRHHYVLPAGRFIRFELKSSNGYSISVGASQGRDVSLTTAKDGVSTEYDVRNANVGADRVKARLPGLGLISVRFHPRGRAHQQSRAPGCEGRRPIVQPGVVRGTVKFTGERAYTQVEAHAVHAETVEWETMRCRYGTPRRRRSRKDWTNDFSAWEETQLFVSFSALKYRPGVLRDGRVAFNAATGTFDRSLRIVRSAFVLAPASAFRIPEPDTYPEHLIFTPPPPFSGSGTFARTPESVFTWEGDLSIQFPGINPMPLTGPRFSPHYCALRGCVEQQAEESEPGFLRPAG